jgi:hypothetical protein
MGSPPAWYDVDIVLAVHSWCPGGWLRRGRPFRPLANPAVAARSLLPAKSPAILTVCHGPICPDPARRMTPVPESTPSPGTVELHFDLNREVGYTLKAFGRSVPLQRHSPETLAQAAADLGEETATHFATLEPPTSKVGLMRIYGPPDADNIPTLESMAIYVNDQSNAPAVYGTTELAQALMFLHPNLTVLAPTVNRQIDEILEEGIAGKVLQAIASSPDFPQLKQWLDNLQGERWNTTVKLTGDDGQPKHKADGSYWYELVHQLHNLRAQVWYAPDDYRLPPNART